MNGVTVSPAHPCLRPFPLDEWTVAEPIEITWARPGRAEIKFVVAKDYVTDLASIPRLVRPLISKSGRHRVPSIVHDFCYAGRADLYRPEADELFLTLMTLYQVPIWKRWAMYRAVCIFGGRLWWGRRL